MENLLIEQQSSQVKKKVSRMKHNEMKWIDSTKFNCIICDTNILGRKNVKHHFQNFHEGTNPFPEGMRKRLHVSVQVVEGEFYFCKIEGCERSLKTYYDNINQHLANVHKMPMVQYHDIYEKKLYEKKQILQQSIVKRRPKQQEIKQIVYHKSQPKSSPSLPGFQVKFPWIYKDMVYKCKDCEQDLLELEGIKVHFKTFHNTKFLHGIRPSPSLKNVSSYICKVGSCKEKIQPFYESIKKHLKVHQLTVMEYHKTYETQVEKEDKMESDFSEHKSPMKPYITFKAKSHLKSDSWSGVKWYNRCKFWCQICQGAFNGYEIRSHMASCHKQNETKKYFPITTDKYKCKICDMTISFLQIKSHVYSKHRLLFSEYGRRFENRNLNRKRKKLNSNERQNEVSNLSTVKVKAESAFIKIEDNNSSKRKLHDLINNPKVKKQKCVLKCNICYLICYSVPAMKNHIRSDHEGKSTSSFTDVDESKTEDVKTSSKESTVKKEVASKNLMELVDDILKSSTDSSIPKQTSSEDNIKQSKNKTFYRCPFKNAKNHSACDFNLSKEEMKLNNCALAVDHIQLEHYAQAQQETSIKWEKTKA